MEWMEWCRLCGKEKGNQIDIFIKSENHSNISQAIQKHFLVTINHNEEIPTKICISCHEYLIALLNFTDKTNKVQLMYSEIEYLIKLDTKINLAELRIKYSIGHFSARSENVSSISKSENEETEKSLNSKRITIKNLNKKLSLDFNINGIHPDDFNDCQDIFSEANEINSKKIKREVNQNIETVAEIKNELKEENDVSDENSITDCDNPSDNNDIANDSKFISPYMKKTQSSKANEIQIKKLRNKKNDDNPKRVKKKYKDEEKKIQCEICSMKFVRENNLSAHLKKAHKIVKELPPCEYCGKICKTKQKLKFHRELHLPSEERQKLLFKCPSCDQKFTQKGAMRSHIRGTHSHERPFICEACGKAFTSQSNLWAHRKKTHEEDMMPCEICQKICKNSSSLRKHMSTHKEPSIPCTVCGILLKTKKTLKNHMLVHSDIKAFQCNYCGKEFKRDITLQLHMIIHSGLKPYVCRFCEQTYANPSNCKKHEKHSHPAEYQAAEGVNGPSQPHRVLKKLPNIKQLKAMLEDMKAAKEIS